ncbi:methionine permease, partial [Spiromyces aspiralis]
TFLYAVGGGVDMPQKNPFLFAHHDWIGRAIGAAATTLVVLLNIVSVRWSLRVVNVLAVMKSLTLLIICIVGIVVLAGGIPVAPNDNWARGFRGTSTQAYNYVSAMNKIFWAYEGWGNLSYAGGELKNPRRNLPLSMGIGLGLITVLYVLANVAFFSVVPIDQTDDSGTIIGAVFTTKVFGTIAGEIILPIIMALSSLGVNIGEIYSGARLLHSAADVGFVPFGHYVAQIHPTFKTPMYSLLIIWVLSLVFLFVPPPGKTFDLLVDLVSYPMWYFYALAITGCIILRRKFPAHPRRTFRAPISVCVLFVLACLFLAFAVFIPPRGRQGSVRSNSYLIGPLVALGFMVLMVVPWALRMFWYAKRYGREYDAWIAKEENAIATEGLGIAVESRLSFRDIEDTYGSTPWRIVQNYPYIQ